MPKKSDKIQLPEAEHGLPSELRQTMKDLGYLHELDVEILTSTSPRTRARWESPKGVMFGNERWYPIAEIKRYLDEKAKAVEVLGDDVVAL